MEQSHTEQELPEVSTVNFEIEDVESSEDYELKAAAYQEVVDGHNKELEALPQPTTFESGGKVYPAEEPFGYLRSTVQLNMQAEENNLQKNIRS